MDRSELDFDTLAAHAGLGVRVEDRISTVPPIDLSTTFTYDSIAGVHDALLPEPRGFAYSRNANPTVAGLEAAIAPLEGAEDVVAFASGMAAIHAALTGCGVREGDTVLATPDLYGVTRNLLVHLSNAGIRTVYADLTDLESAEQALAEYSPKVLYFESISNPLLRVCDIQGLASLARRYGAVSIIDNTFATPYLVRPLALGVDIVVHSATKYLAGHGDAIVGLAAGTREIMRGVRSVRTLSGGVLGPFEAWLTMRGVRTLPLRMDRHGATALTVAQALDNEPWVSRVYYPGLPDHPQHDVAARMFGSNFGGMVSFDVRADRENTLRFIDALELIRPGTTLGDVETLVLYPPLSSHRGLTLEELRAAGLGDGLVRMSVGLETSRDLLTDLRRAAKSARIGC